MLLYIDPREGSEPFLKEFEGESEEMTLDGGDIAFWGRGPEDTPWFIGIEYKKVDDMVKCIQSGRFSGEQWPKMRKLFDLSFLLIEGNYQPDFWGQHLHGSPRLFIPFKGQNGIRFGLNYQSFDNYLTSVAMISALQGKPCIVKPSRNKKETLEIIKDLYRLYQKPFEDHQSLGSPNLSKVHNVSYEIEILRVEPDDPGYPEFTLRRALFQIKGIGWDLAGAFAKYYKNMEIAMLASQRELESLDFKDTKRGIGKTLAKRIYETLHGHPDPDAISKRKKKSLGLSEKYLDSVCVVAENAQ